MNVFYTDIMVDIETTDVAPDRGGIIQLAAYKFNLQDRTVDTDGFDRCMTLPPTRRWEEGTREWWLGQKRSILQDIFDRAEDPKTVMQDFADWCYQPETLRFWSKPSSFDFSFVESYFRDFGIITPFDFRQTMDMRSFLRGLYFPQPLKDLGVPFIGDAHNARFDVLHQIQVVFAHLEDVAK